MDKLRRADIGRVIVGLIIVGVGVYYLLVNTLGYAMPDVDWDKVWPFAVMALGVGILWRAWDGMDRDGHGKQPM